MKETNRILNEEFSFVSPNKIMEAAKIMMLDGKEPVTDTDWQNIVNFLAVNIAPELNFVAIKLMKKLYDMPISENTIARICQFHRQRQAEEAKIERGE